MLQLYHTAYAVPDLDRALVDFRSALGGRATEPQPLDMLVHMPLDAPEPRRVRGRSAWILGLPAPVELWEGGADTPWALADPDAGPVLHHSCYWADDMDAVAARLEAIGFARELTPVHDGPGLLGFCYLRNPAGARIEIVSAAEKPSVEDWITKGVPRHPEWLRHTR